MSRLEKRIAGLRDKPRGTSVDELISILVKLGFERRDRGRAPHYGYKHPRLPHIKLTIPKSQNPLKSYLIKQALTAIDMLMELEDDG